MCTASPLSLSAQTTSSDCNWMANPMIFDPFRSSSEQWKSFSAAEHLAQHVDSSWESLKEQGNDSLKHSDLETAAKLYRQAAQLATGYLKSGLVREFIRALESWPQGSAQARFAEKKDLWEGVIKHLPNPRSSIKMQLPDGLEMTAEFPNMGAAVSWANHAQTLLLDGKPEKALKSARKATSANPEYIKAHHREMKALEALGKHREAKEIAEEIRDFERCRKAYPAQFLALLDAGWIDWERATLVYMPVRFTAAAEWLQANLEPLPADKRPEHVESRHMTRRVEVRASIVPFQGGQGLCLTVNYAWGEIQCMGFQMLDSANGEIADKPPNGHASEAALRLAPVAIGKFIVELEQWKLRTVAVMCGQGLFDHVPLIDAGLKQGSKAQVGKSIGIRPMKDLIVYRAHTTGASMEAGEAIGLPFLPFFQPDDGAMRARAALAGWTGLDEDGNILGFEEPIVPVA